MGLESDMTKDYAKLCAALQEIDVFKAVLIENCKIEFEKVIDKHIRMKSRHQEFFMSMTRGVVSISLILVTFTVCSTKEIIQSTFISSVT